MIRMFVLFAVIVAFVSAAAPANEPAVAVFDSFYGPSLYGGSLRAGFEAYRFSESRRRAAFDRQLWLNGLLRPPRVAGYGFSAWPFGGSLFGPGFYQTVPQPSGHRITFYGPNRYTYEPIYTAPFLPPGPLPAPVPVEPQPRPIPPADPDELFAQATAAFRAGRFGQCNRQLEKLFDAAPRHAGGRAMHVQALFARGEFRPAVQALRELTAKLPSGDWGLEEKDYACFAPAAEVFTRQLRALEQAIDQTPRDAEARLLLAYQYFFLGHTQPALHQLAQSEKLSPGDDVVQRLAGHGRRVAAAKDGPLDF